MTNTNLQFDIINALNEFESYGLDTISGGESLEQFRNHIFKHFDQLRGDIYKSIERDENINTIRIERITELLNNIESTLPVVSYTSLTESDHEFIYSTRIYLPAIYDQLATLGKSFDTVL